MMHYLRRKGFYEKKKQAKDRKEKHKELVSRCIESSMKKQNAPQNSDNNYVIVLADIPPQSLNCTPLS